ncbi:hypothetical protein [Lacticaseibacillus brantae]|uniref:hypothetical protein n=1 Tax=Lacticaseibacillus brantae TaxID=943673 RepID=UPI00070E0BB7|nr:hypothetical protein [Lacticaseibacillus brantae]
MDENKLSPARIAANKKWDEANKERKRYIVKRSTAKSFIKNLATLSDLAELTELISTRKIELAHKNNPTDN